MHKKQEGRAIIAIGSRQELLLSLLSFTCLTAAWFAPQVQLKLGLLIAGIILGLFIGFLFVRRVFTLKDADAQKAALRTLSDKDSDSVFITDRAFAINYANPTAKAKFDNCDSETLTEVLGRFMADPATTLRQKMETAGYGDRQDIITQKGHLRLGVAPLGSDALVWRIDFLPNDISADDTESLLPTIRVDPQGAVVRSNAAALALLGKSPGTLAEVLGDADIPSGGHLTINGVDGDKTVAVAITDDQNGTRSVVLLPTTPTGAMPLSAGWDAIEDLPVPLLKIAPDGLVLASNRQARHLLGVANTDGKHVADMLDGLGRPINDWLREGVEGRESHVSQFLRGRGDSQDTFVQVTLNIAGDPTDRHLIAVLNDVTELKTLEAQFVQSQKMQAIGQLAGGVAHDFNNLLTAISGHCDLLLLRHDQGDQNYGDLIQIHQNANRAASLVGQLLAFSRKQNLQPEIIDLRDTLADLTHLLNRLVGEKVTLSLNHDPALAQIKADKRQLEQVLMNLVVNARDAMPSGGEIKVETENMTLETQMVRDRAVVPPGEYVVVRVIDEGHGIAPEKLPKIFEPFYTTKRTGEGTGLGLSTAYGIVKQTGGYIFAESEVENGTQFSLLFPSYDLPVSEPVVLPLARPETPDKPAEGVVLLVEDEAPVRAFASRALRLHGYTVLEADCAEAALVLLEDKELRVDIFVTDVIMPGMDGPTWVREALKTRQHTKVVFVSGYAEDAFGDEKSRIPNSVFLPKPFSLNDLTVTVRNQLAEDRMSA